MTRRRVFAQFAPKPAKGLVGYYGRPDGAAVDAEGSSWVAMYEGGRVLRLSPAGELLAEVRMPARCPTMPCFGGADLEDGLRHQRERQPAARRDRRLPAPRLRVRVPGRCAGPAGALRRARLVSARGGSTQRARLRRGWRSTVGRGWVHTYNLSWC